MVWWIYLKYWGALKSRYIYLDCIFNVRLDVDYQVVDFDCINYYIALFRDCNIRNAVGMTLNRFWYSLYIVNRVVISVS